MRFVIGLVAVLVLSFLLLAGCAKQAEVSSTPEAVAKAPTSEELAARKAVDAAADAAEEEEVEKERAARAAAGLQPVFFDYDRSVIRDDAKPIMQANAEWLKANAAAKVRIEGNCDERGTIEYNQALGQRRATAVKEYLVALGIKASRISLISYGKEKPACTENTEGCWQQNRRGDLMADVN
jgi:peptidoglycan-associated lipoprotein